YRPDQNDESRTICEKKVLATSVLFGFKTTLETFAIKRYKKNQELASLGLEFTLHKLFLPHLPLPPVIGIKKLDTRSFSSKLSDKAKQFLKSSSPTHGKKISKKSRSTAGFYCYRGSPMMHRGVLAKTRFCTPRFKENAARLLGTAVS
ncbi:unnamed protein product, partial [Rotaria socialis]